MIGKSSEDRKYGAPFILILAYIILDYGRPFDFVPFLQVFKLPFLVSFLLFLAWLKTTPKPSSPQVTCLILFIFVMAKTIPFATNNYIALWDTVDMARLVFFVCLPIIAFVNSFEKIETFLKVWIASHIFLAMYGLINLGKPGKMFGAHLGDENDFALAVSLAIPYAYFLFLATKNTTQKILYLASAVLFISAVVASLSRGGFLALAAVLLYCWWRTPGKFKATVIAGVLVAGILTFGGEEYWKEIESITDSEDESASDRLYLWDKSWQMFLDYPFMGVGAHNFGINVQDYEDIERSFEMGVKLSWGRMAHSLYFTLLPEQGIPGTILFCLLLYFTWKDRRYIINSISSGNSFVRTGYKSESLFDTADDLRKIYFMTLAVNGSLLSFLVAGGFLSVLYYPHFWLLIAFSTALRHIHDTKLQELTQEDETFKYRPGPISTVKSALAN